MSVLQDQCPTEDFEIIKGIVSKEIGFDDVFASFEEEPVGAASIGQGKGGNWLCYRHCRSRFELTYLCCLILVHRATLKDGTP